MDALNAWKYANWTAIAAIVGTLLYIGLSAYSTVWLRNHPRKRKIRMPPCGVDGAVKWVTENRARWRDQLPEPINRRAPYHTHHLIDFERSKIIVLPDGSVHAECCVAHCGIFVILGRDVVNATIIPDQHDNARRA